LIRFFDEGNKVPCIVKTWSDYCGDGVTKIDYKNHVVSYVSKSLWKQENVLVQKFIADSIGRSIRAICFQNRVAIVFHQISKSGDFRSNLDCDDFYSVEPITNDVKSELYKDIAQRACNSIGNLTVAGVDLIDSPSDGVLVLEINSFPELFESWEATGICTVKKFIQAFMNKVENSIVK
jgi:ribosomal protein S6--L-glutamate ligase